MEKKDLKSWMLLLLLSLIWGGSYILMKQGLKSYSYWQVSSIRMISAFVFLLPFTIKNLKKLSRKNLIPILVVAFIGNLIPSILFPLGQTKVDSNVAGVLNSLVPVFVLIIGILFFKKKTSLMQILGVIIGLAGAALLITSKNPFRFGTMNFFALYIVTATILYSININQVSIYLKNLDGLEIASLAFLFIGPTSLVIFLNTDLNSIKFSPEIIFHTLCIITLGLMGSAVAVSIANQLITKSGPMFASSVTYIIPVFAIFWGILDGEKLNLFQILATIIIMLGVYLVNKK
ncbi:MAG: DMT family transporter [Bacteroidales bacterium]|jgi:drug/metabolite transporter (DMT)-like permease|nr:DMT family transporter [Bacteroidales bacterium]HRS99880.1 DMT family transporter [Bacteroidales bacterium]HRT80250.1 DMT family transporter [Bacteroidales bacterium]